LPIDADAPLAGARDTALLPHLLFEERFDTAQFSSVRTRWTNSAYRALFRAVPSLAATVKLGALLCRRTPARFSMTAEDAVLA
jgi:hypothetical protein